MDRKKIILSAISINAGLLVLLLLTALHREEKVELPLMNHPPFVFEARAETPAFATASPQPEPEIVHQLPPILESVSPPPAMSVAAPLPRGIEVVVKKGDTLDKIAKIHKTTIDELLRFNQLQSTFLRVGQVLRVPAGNVASAPVKEPVKELDYYIVKVGETPWTIAHKHHMKVDELLKLNQLNSEKAKRLKPGDRLRVK